LQLLAEKAKLCAEMFRQNFKKMTMIITKIEEFILTKNKVYDDNIVLFKACAHDKPKERLPCFSNIAASQQVQQFDLPLSYPNEVSQVATLT